ncbi:Uncharacterized protein SCF082_LOCUS28374 [Durusdinium trenchii]|uniref:Transmembrane protein 107 n=1 Tax=Durusdinium trenchii TaxID=1381693 RepID=A0ABP0MKL7_9DINO
MDAETGSEQSNAISSPSRFAIYMVYFIEFIRIALTTAGYGISYYYFVDSHFTKSETTMASKVAESVRWLQLGLSAGLSAPCALEGIFFAEAAAREKGYDRGFDYATGRNPYATQSTLWFLVSFIIGLITFFVYPRETPAQLVLILLQLLFFTLSAFNHCYEALVHGNWVCENTMRPILSFTMIMGAVPMVYEAFFGEPL